MSLYQFTKSVLFLSIPCLVWFFYPSSSIVHEGCGESHAEVDVFSQEEKEMAFQLLQPYFAQAGDQLNLLAGSTIQRPSVCFDPDTDPDFIEQFYKDFDKSVKNSLGFGNIGDKRIANQWTTTATDGGGIAQGQSITLTWSYVPDGTAIGNNCFGNTGDISDFITFFNGIHGGPMVPGDFTTAPWHALFVGMFDDWSSKSGLNFVYEPNDDGATYASNTGANPGILGTRGDIRIGGDRIDGNSGILACNYFPNVGDMILDTDDNFYSNNPGLGTTNVLAHEIGHGLGFRHVCPTSQTKLMEPFISTMFDGPQEDDILAANRNYGDVDAGNDASGTAVALGTIADGVTVVQNCLSIDDDADVDFYSFTVVAPGDVTVTLTPTGTTYLEGPQNANGSCSAGVNFDALTISDISFDVLDTDGSSVLGSGNGNAAGIAETNTVSLPAAGTYFVRHQQEGTAVDDVQMYSFSLLYAAASCVPMISEIMYNPNCSEDNWEWIELYNPCPTAIDLTGWVVDDINGAFHSSANISAGMIPSMGTAILYNSGDVTAAEFECAWGDCANLVAVSNWGAMGLNNGGDQIGLWTDFASYIGDHATHANAVDIVDYDDDGTTWPADDGTSSIYLNDLTADNNVGANWSLSSAGGMTPAGDGYESMGDGCTDVGSPCTELTCGITAIAVSNISACMNVGSDMDGTNDTFTADVTVTFVNPPCMGNLVLSGSGTGTVATTAITGTMHTFTGVLMSANGGPISLTANFDAKTACTFTNATAGTAPSQCSTMAACDIMGTVAFTAPTCPMGMDGTITFSVTCTTCTGLEFSIDNGVTWLPGNIFTGLAAGSYTVIARDTGDPSCMIALGTLILPAGVDTTDPTVASCPTSPLNINNDMGLCSAVVTYAAPTFDDNCDGMGLAGMMTGGLASGSVFPVGTTTVTFTYTDAAGNGPATCTFDVVVVDAEDPMAVCMAATVQLDVNGMATVLPADVEGGSTDNCGIASTSVAPNMVDCNVITGGVTPPDDLVISAVYDGPLSGGVPKGIELYAINTIPDLSIYAVGSANNGGGTDGQEFTFPAVPVAAGTFIYVTSQAAGFTTFFGFAPDYVDGSMSINGDDAIELFKNGVVIDVFGDINTDGSGQPWEYTDGWAARVPATGPDGSTFVIGNWIFSGRDALDGEATNAGAATPVPIGSYFFPLGTGTVDVTLTVVDAAGNSSTCTATVTVEDNIPPTPMCLPTFSIDLDASGQAVLTGADIDNGSTDNCGVASLSVMPFQFTCADVGAPIQVTLTVTDIDGTTATCTTDVTVNDTEAPIAICANPVACLDANGMASVTAADTDGGSSDNCNVASVSVSANNFTCADLMPLVPTQSLLISGVIDGPLPGGIPKGVELYVLQDIPDLSLYGVGFANNGGGTDGQEFTFPAVSASAGDYIYIATDAGSFNTFFGFNPDFTTNSAAINGDDAIELFFNGAVIDIFGDINTDGTGQPWEYLDGWAYRVSATGPDGTSFVLGNFTYSGPNALDGEVDNATAATPFPIGTYNFPTLGGTGTVTLTVTDDQGTTSMCTANVLILDKLPPVANCQAGSVTLDANGMATVDGSIFDNGSTDNCGGALTFAVAPEEVTCDMVGTIQVTVTVTDESGNSSDCTADLLVIASSACPPPDITNQDGPNIADPCTCLGNGLFEEEVVIGPAGAGQNWVIASTTLIDPATGNPFTPGTPLTEIPDPANPGMVLYIIDGQHIDAVGYTLTASSPAFPGSNLTISNTCFYPDPSFGQVVGDFCLNTPPFTFTGTERRGAEGTGQFIFDGMLLPTIENPVGSGIWETTFDVAALGLGSYVIQFQFDAGNPPSAALPVDVGCVDLIEFAFNVIETPSTLACNDNVQISLAENCESVITADMILEGTYGCFDDYQIDVMSGSRVITNSPTVTNNNIGQNLIAKVTHLISGTSCWGTITVEDKWVPEVDCGGPFVVDCTEGGIGSIPPATGTDNCDPSPVVSLISEISNVDECGVSTYTRTYIATDIYGNTSRSCDQVIQITQADFTFPDDITWSCEQYAAFANVIDPTALHPLILAEAANMDQALFCCIAGTDGDDVAGVDPYAGANYWMDGEDLDVSLDPLYNDDVDNPITDGNGACGNATAQTDEFEDRANFSYIVGCEYLQDCDIAPSTAHAPEIIQVPVFLPPLAPPFGTNDIKRGLEDADVLAATGSGVPNVFGSDCPYAVTFVDERLEACAGADMNVVFKILRTWTLLNWCTGQVFSDVQVIKVLDKKPPVLDFSDFDSDISANQTLGTASHLDCSSNGIIGIPDVENNCSGISEIRLFTPAGPGIPVLDNDGNTTGFQIPAPFLAIGNHIVNFDVTDMCGNRSNSTAVVRVLDDTPPAPICREFTEIGLTASDLTQIPADFFDEGSYDQCAPVYFKIRRMEEFGCNSANVDDTRLGFEVDRRQEWFDDYTFFCCEDVGDTINVIMRVYDFDPGIRSIRTDRTTLDHTSSLDRRYNDCMVRVYISDKVRPTCIPPADVWANCTDLPDNIDYTDIDQLTDLFGSAIAEDNCGAVIEELNPNVQIDLCGVGQVIRRFRAEDNDGNRSLGNCTQTIMIQSVIDYKLLVPGDFEEECDNASPQDFEFEEFACDLFAINSEDLELPASTNGECKKIIRTWSLINWCEYDGFSDPVEIPRRDLNLDGRPGDGEGGSNNPVTGVRHGATHMYDYAGTVLVLNDNPLVVIPSGGYYTYNQHVKIFDNTAPDVSYDGDIEFCGGDLDEDPCTGEVNIAPTIDDMCTGTDHRWELTAFSSTFGNADFAGDGDLAGRYPLGTHTVRFYVTDECGNLTEFDVTFEVIDCKAPTPVCHNGLSIDVMPASGMVELWAVDFDASSFDYCHPLKFRINRVEDRNGDGFITSDDYLNSVPQFDSIQLTCANVGTLTNVQLWVGEESTDSQNNWDYCVTYVDVQDNNGACNGPRPTTTASGAIRMENDVTVGKVEVNLSGAASSMIETTDDGNYNFDNLFVGDDYSIAPYRNDDHTLGISTYDLVLISKHVLNVQLLDSPYKVIAADVNRSNNVSTLDIVALRKIVLRVENEFANNTAWRFVDRNHVFSNPIKPWEGGIPEVVNFNNIEDVTNMASFIAIKIGDVSLDVNPNDVDGISPRTQGSIEFNAPDMDFQKGELIEVPVSINELASIEGYQFTLEFDDKVLEFVDLKNGLASAEHFGMSHLPKGKITTSWVAAQSAPAFAEMFTLVFKAKQSGSIADVVEVNSSLTKAEGYSAEGDLLDIQLNFGSKSQIAEFKLHQNNPNPFDNQTLIAFELPKAASVTMTISDINGKVVYLKKGDFPKGTQTIQIKHSELSGSGVYYYQVDTGNDIATRKMILID